jgi:hypothetical protein
MQPTNQPLGNRPLGNQPLGVDATLYRQTHSFYPDPKPQQKGDKPLEVPGVRVPRKQLGTLSKFRNQTLDIECRLRAAGLEFLEINWKKRRSVWKGRNETHVLLPLTVSDKGYALSMLGGG